MVIDASLAQYFHCVASLAGVRRSGALWSRYAPDGRSLLAYGAFSPAGVLRMTQRRGHGGWSKWETDAYEMDAILRRRSEWR